MATKTKKPAAPLAPAALPDDSIPINAVSKLRKLIIQNFRCIGNSPVTVELDDIVVLVGPNNAGKSTILRAYEVIAKNAALTLDDFYEHNAGYTPTIELHTAIVNDLPANRWIKTENGENIVRERWSWTKPDVTPKREGFDVNDGWSENVPWGAANVAAGRRPSPHRLSAFDDPEEQVKQVTDLLFKAFQKGCKGQGKHKVAADGTPELDENDQPKKSTYGQLLESVVAMQSALAEQSAVDVEHAETHLSGFVSKVFPKHKVKLDARPEEDPTKVFAFFFKASTGLKMGPEGGHLSAVEKQGSGARRTLMWAVLRYLAEKDQGQEAGPGNLLLLDEPELCLHPNAIRESCETLYKLPEAGKWQVILTTHSPAFIDLSRDNTTVVRVERDGTGAVQGTTVFRPKKAKLSAGEKLEMKLLNAFDPYVAEFFFGGRTILVEGDTEYTAFRYVISQNPADAALKDIHIVRARGKGTIALLARILNQFDARYSVLHDSDRPTLENGNGNPAWGSNNTIHTEVQKADPTRVRLVAALVNFESAMFGVEVSKDKPYNAFTTLSNDAAACDRVRALLHSLLDSNQPLPATCLHWANIAALEAALPPLP